MKYDIDARWNKMKSGLPWLNRGWDDSPPAPPSGPTASVLGVVPFLDSPCGSLCCASCQLIKCRSQMDSHVTGNMRSQAIVSLRRSHISFFRGFILGANTVGLQRDYYFFSPGNLWVHWGDHFSSSIFLSFKCLYKLLATSLSFARVPGKEFKFTG